MAITDPRFLQAQSQIMQITDGNRNLTSQVQKTLTRLVECLMQSSTGASTETIAEREMPSQRLQNFRIETSAPYHYFRQRHWTGLTVRQIASIAELFAHVAQLPIDREVKRRKNVLFQWLDQHWDVCLPMAEDATVEFADAA
jgi:hypothetical protein